jgi:hypothetical protein
MCPAQGVPSGAPLRIVHFLFVNLNQSRYHPMMHDAIDTILEDLQARILNIRDSL